MYKILTPCSAEILKWNEAITVLAWLCLEVFRCVPKMVHKLPSGPHRSCAEAGMSADQLRPLATGTLLSSQISYVSSKHRREPRMASERKSQGRAKKAKFHGAKVAPDRTKVAKLDPKWLQDGPDASQDGLRSTQDGSKTIPRRSWEVLRGFGGEIIA